jgi:hypothetical protein
MIRIRTEQTDHAKDEYRSLLVDVGIMVQKLSDLLPKSFHLTGIM